MRLLAPLSRWLDRRIDARIAASPAGQRAVRGAAYRAQADAIRAAGGQPIPHPYLRGAAVDLDEAYRLTGAVRRDQPGLKMSLRASSADPITSSTSDRNSSDVAEASIA